MYPAPCTGDVQGPLRRVLRATVIGRPPLNAPASRKRQCEGERGAGARSNSNAVESPPWPHWIVLVARALR
jgi:hypothetical protein